MRWLLRRPGNELPNFKQFYHKSMNFTHILLQICTIEIIISKIYPESNSNELETQLLLVNTPLFLLFPYTRSRPENLQRITGQLY
jgi:hypothetical protein